MKKLFAWLHRRYRWVLPNSSLPRFVDRFLRDPCPSAGVNKKGR
jgi:hypothetical protein